MLNEIKIIVMRKNNNINATKLCQNIGGKRFRSWLQNNQADMIITSAEKFTGIKKIRIIGNY